MSSLMALYKYEYTIERGVMEQKYRCLVVRSIGLI